jgi:Fe-S-cluster containining protein
LTDYFTDSIGWDNRLFRTRNYIGFPKFLWYFNNYNPVETQVNFEYPTALRFHCTKCGICCGDTKEKTRHILLLKAEAEHIAKSTAHPITEFATRTEKTPYVYEMKKTTTDGKCVFLKNTRCTIYPLRPLICRFYPFELKTSQSGKYQFLFTKECPGINQGRTLKEAYFKKLLLLAHIKHKQATADH